MTDKLQLNANDATLTFHAYTMALYFLCIFGGIVSDVWLGNFLTILLLSIVYCTDSTVLALGAIPNIGISAIATFHTGLVLISVGGGGIKPCVSAFGGDQFQLPAQMTHMARFFSIFYLSINLGSLMSTALTPILRTLHCFDETDCYSLAFAVPAILMFTAIRKTFLLFQHL